MSYKTQNFLDKNKDFVVAEHQALMEASIQHFSQLLFPPDPTVSTVCIDSASHVCMPPWRGTPLLFPPLNIRFITTSL